MSKYIDPEMILTAFKQKMDKKINKTILGEIHKVSYQIGVYVDPEKLKQWLDMCYELENIDESERIGQAVKDKFIEKEKMIDSLKKNIEELTEENEQLKKELAELESNHELLIDTFQVERENLCKEIKKHSEARQRAIEKIKELEKEIDELKFIQRNSNGLIEKVSKDAQKQLRHEICEEIREKLKVSSFDMLYNGSDYGRFMAIIDQIEGEK